MDWKERLAQIRNRLERERDELGLKARLAKMDARDEMAGLEKKWEAFRARMADIEIGEVTEEVRDTADRLASELRRGYDRLRERMRDRADEEDSTGGEPDGGERSGQAAPEDGEGAYTMGYGEEFRQVLERRSAPTHASHLLPRLRPGMRVLDFGCGPGTISLGLADAVAPGELHGIDVEESQIEMAVAAARAGGHENASFRAGDVTDLPFEDDSFDAAHCNAVLMHVPDTGAALAEVMRVLKPGGLLSAQDLITDSSFLEPTFGNLDGAWTTFAKLLAGNGGHPQMGKEAKAVLQKAGFADVEAHAFFELFHTEADRMFFHGFITQWFFSPEVVAAASKHGLATQQELDGWSSSLEKWKNHSAGCAAFAWGGALGRKP